MEASVIIHYDAKLDVFYLSFSEPRPMNVEELRDDILLQRDAVTGNVLGVEILNFSKHFPTGSETITFPISVDALLKPQTT